MEPGTPRVHTSSITTQRAAEWARGPQCPQAERAGGLRQRPRPLARLSEVTSEAAAEQDARRPAAARTASDAAPRGGSEPAGPRLPGSSSVPGRLRGAPGRGLPSPARRPPGRARDRGGRTAARAGAQASPGQRAASSGSHGAGARGDAGTWPRPPGRPRPRALCLLRRRHVTGFGAASSAGRGAGGTKPGSASPSSPARARRLAGRTGGDCARPGRRGAGPGSGAAGAPRGCPAGGCRRWSASRARRSSEQATSARSRVAAAAPGAEPVEAARWEERRPEPPAGLGSPLCAEGDCGPQWPSRGARCPRLSLPVRWARPPSLGHRSPLQGRVGGRGGHLARRCVLAGLGSVGTEIGDWWSRDHPSPNTHKYTHTARPAGLGFRKSGRIRASELGAFASPLRAAVGPGGGGCLRHRPHRHGPRGARDRRNRTVGRLVKNNAVSQPWDSISKEKPPLRPGAGLRSSLPGLGPRLSLCAAQIPAPGGASYLWSEQAPGTRDLSPSQPPSMCCLDVAGDSR